MEWSPDEADEGDIIDRRAGGGGGSGVDLGSVLGGALGGGGGRGKKAGGGLMGVVLMVAAIFILPKLMGGGGGFDLSTVPGLEQLPQVSSGAIESSGDPSDMSVPPDSDPDLELKQFSNVVITDVNDMWAEQFSAAGRQYQRTQMVLFASGTSSGCGNASSAMGPFYCGADNLVYIDLDFFRDLATRFGAAGDFAQAYVIAHEVAHHVQNELGISDEVRRIEARDPDAATGPDGLSVRQELQADCLAGVWAHSAFEEGRLEPGDIDEALAAAAGVGDDRIQRQATGSVNPEGFTHGTSAQRSAWFTTGYQSGDSDSCDTFSVNNL